MQKVISFIIPSYNAEPYLDQCLKSFLHPDCMEQIEVLIVNDGSKDGTKALAERYMEDYPDIFRLIDKENGGHGSAINVGVKKASGRYLKVIDADRESASISGLSGKELCGCGTDSVSFL